MNKKILAASIFLELCGIGLLTTAIAEGITHNPTIYLATAGSCLLACGGFLFNKVFHRRQTK